MDPQRKRPLLWMLMALPVLLCLLLVAGYLSYVTQQYKTGFPVKIEGDWPLAGDPEIGFVAAPGSAMTRHHPRQGMTFNVYTDGRGARVDSPGESSPPAVDILTIGGSFAWGLLVENEETFTSIVSRELGLSSANLAYGSYGTLQALQLLKKNADLAPKVIIYGVITAHEERNLSPCAPSYSPFCIPVAYVDMDDRGAPYIHAPPTGYSAAFGQGFYREVATATGFDVKDPVWGARIALAKLSKRRYLAAAPEDTQKNRTTAMTYLLGEMAAEARRMDATLVVVYMPFMGTNPPNPASDVLKQAMTAIPEAHRKHVMWIDMTPRTVAHYKNPFAPSLGVPQDGHPTRLAHRMIANEIVERLTQRQRLP